MTNTRRRSNAHLIAECVEVPDCINLQCQVDTAACCSLEVVKDVIAEPLHNIHVRVCSRSRLATCATYSLTYTQSEHRTRDKDARLKSHFAHSSLEEVHRCGLVLPHPHALPMPP